MDFEMTEDYHTHTFYSDGVGSIEENVESARAKGLRSIGITDHGFYHVAHGISRKQVTKMREEIERLRLKFPDMEILLGVEADLINMKGDLDLKKSDLELFDYIIFGVHKFACSLRKPSSIWFALMNFWVKNSEKRKQKVTDSYILALQKYPVKLVVHPNYATHVDIKRLAEASKERGIWVELNGKRIEMEENEAKALIDSGVTLVIGSDAHSPQRIAECSVPKEFIKKHNIPLDRIVNIKLKEQKE